MLTAALLAASFAADVETLLEAGFRGDLAGHREAVAAYERIGAPTPAERYAMALVHLRHTKHGDAADELAGFRGDEKEPWLWVTFVRLKAEARDTAPLLEDLPSLGGLASSIASEDGRPEAERFVRFLGRLMAAVELAEASEDAENVWRQTLTALPASLQASFDHGYEATLEAADLRVIELRTRQAKRLAREEQRVRESLESAKQRIEAAKTEREQIAVTVEDLEAVVDDRGQDFDTALDGIDAMTESLDVERRTVFQTITTLTLDLRLALELEERDDRLRRRRRAIVDPLTGEALFPSDFIRSQLVLENAKLAEVERRRSEVEALTQRLQRQFAAEQATVAQAQEQLTAADAARQREVERTLKRLARIQVDLAAAEKKPPGSTPRIGFRTLVPWDFEAEKNRLLATVTEASQAVDHKAFKSGAEP